MWLSVYTNLVTWNVGEVTADMEQACSWEPDAHTNVLAGAPYFTHMHTDVNTRTRKCPVWPHSRVL
jgi:hypothetical protein